MQRRDTTERPDRRPQPKGLGAGPIVAIVVLVGGALAVATLIRETRESADVVEASDEEQHVPFAKYKDEAPPERGGSAPDRPTRTARPAPLGLAEDARWIEALAIAEGAGELLKEANRARAKGDSAMYQAQGKSAKEAYDRALILTAELEEELVEEYGDRDPQVREIMRTRTRWFDKLRVLHKTTGR